MSSSQHYFIGTYMSCCVHLVLRKATHKYDRFLYCANMYLRSFTKENYLAKVLKVEIIEYIKKSFFKRDFKLSIEYRFKEHTIYKVNEAKFCVICFVPFNKVFVCQISSISNDIIMT